MFINQVWETLVDEWNQARSAGRAEPTNREESETVAIRFLAEFTRAPIRTAGAVNPNAVVSIVMPLLVEFLRAMSQNGRPPAICEFCSLLASCTE